MTAVSRPLFIEQGATWRVPFVWTKAADQAATVPGEPWDVTGCKARMQIRKRLKSPAMVTATTENGKITVGGTDGAITIYLSPADTDALTSTTGVYDLEVVFPSGDVHRLLEGAVTIKPNVTRDQP